MEKTLGGDRLGAGKKMKVHLHNYERSTHDLGYIWRSTMSSGTLVPFMSELALPGDTFDINLDCDIKTHPTEGPLFGSYKVQLDTFLCPIRLYNGLLHNNMLGVGMNMRQVYFPLIELTARTIPVDIANLDTCQVNPSSILAYLGIRGIGDCNENAGPKERPFNAIPILAYWEIYKNYYANKQEEIGAVIHNGVTFDLNVIGLTLKTGNDNGVGIAQETDGTGNTPLTSESVFTLEYGLGGPPDLNNIIIWTDQGPRSLAQLASSSYVDAGNNAIVVFSNIYPGEYWVVKSWQYRLPTGGTDLEPKVVTFPLENIDNMRQYLLEKSSKLGPVYINDFSTYGVQNPEPYNYLYEGGNYPAIVNTQEGLGIKTYQSDMFNNWVSTEWIDGPNGISELTSIDTSDGNFTIDALLIAKKVYAVLNRIAVSGGSYNDWIDAVYHHEKHGMAESPMYMGGLSKELVFQEVVSNAAAGGDALGSLAGRGVLGKKHKGGYVHINVDEPSYIIGIVSLTPRVDYSQGNKWDVHLQNMDQLHKPGMDEIGFQEMITEQLAWWNTKFNVNTALWEQKSAGKQPAWLNYMTNVNRVYGNFAIGDPGEMFMVLNRRYEAFRNQDQGISDYEIADLTTYIDPVKFNHIFADTSLDAQNFWAQISVDITARRKMSAKVMPNL